MLRKYLTIGEFADIMKVSTSSIRYYEKEGLLSPCKVDDNGYRLYDFDEIYRMETILLLRKLDVPLKQLKILMKNYSIVDYVEILNSSLKSIDTKIDELQNKRNYIIKKLNYVESFKKAKRHYRIIHMPERILYCLHTGKIFEYTIKETYELMKSKNIDYIDTYQDSYMIPFDNDIFSLCLLSTPGMRGFESFDKVTLKEGLYLNHDIFIGDYTEIDIEISKFYDYIRENNLSPIGNLIIIEKIKYSDFALNKMYFSLQIEVKSSEK